MFSSFRGLSRKRHLGIAWHYGVSSRGRGGERPTDRDGDVGEGPKRPDRRAPPPPPVSDPDLHSRTVIDTLFTLFSLEFVLAAPDLIAHWFYFDGIQWLRDFAVW